MPPSDSVPCPPDWAGIELGELTFAAALAATATEPGLVALHDGSAGWIGLGARPKPITGWADVASATQDATGWSDRAADLLAAPGAGWMPPPGADVVQLDHEFPTTVGWRWRPSAWLACRSDGSAVLVAPDGGSLAQARQSFVRREPAAVPARPFLRPQLRGALTPDWDADGHRQRIERLRQWIAAGECYQANVTLAWRGHMRPDPTADIGLFLALIASHPAGHAGLLRRPGRSVVSHSPECFLRWRGDQVLSEPIKGTRRRTADGSGRAALLASAKDAAELAMIVDLVRNDLGASAVPGSVQVVEPAGVIDLPNLHHRCAQVVAQIRSGVSPADMIERAFPPGSVTGCPQRQALRRLVELESGPRGPYCGTFGWLARDAGDLAVTIRCAVIDTGTEATSVAIHAGGGITADSDAAAEWDEAWAKASALAQALELST